MIELRADLIIAAGLFSVGLWGVTSQRGIVMIIMAIELMLSAANLSVLAFWRYSPNKSIDPHIFAIVVLTIAAIEEAFGMGIALMVFRRRRTQNVDRFQELSQ